MSQSYSRSERVRHSTPSVRIQTGEGHRSPTTIDRSIYGLFAEAEIENVRQVPAPPLPREVPEPPRPIYPGDMLPAWERRESILGGALTRFFGSVLDVTAKALVPGLLGAALFPIIGPFGAFAAAASMSAVTHAIQHELAPLDLHLQDSTIQKLVEPFESSPIDEGKLRRVIEENVLPDRHANEDLRQLYDKLLPNIQNAAAKVTNINIDGDAYGLIEGNNNIVTQTFNFFLQEEKGLLARRASRHSSRASINRPPVIQTGTTETGIQIDGTVVGTVIGDENQITQTYNEIPM